MNENVPRILIVDDQIQNRLLIIEYLEPLGIQIDEANSGKDCLKKLKEQAYTLVILDVQMPDLDGFQVLELMRQDKDLENIPVVFVSAIFDSEEYILKGIEKGAIDFITKPININILQSKVTNFLKLYEKQNALDRLVKTLETINKRLDDSERRFKRITQSANDAIIVLDKNYNVRFWNKASNQIFGFSKYEITFENFLENAIAPGSREELGKLIGSLNKTTSAMYRNTVRLFGKHKNGLEFPIELSLAYFTTTAKEINYTMVIRDITRRVAMEKEALKTKELRESNRIMKEFMDSVSHELRTPMNAILGISNMLLKYNAENLLPKQKEGLEIINQSGGRLLDMINDVLDLSRLDANRVSINNELLDLDKFLASLHSVMLSLIAEKRIKFYIRKSANVPQFIVTDQKKLNQILTNLLGNSAKFTSHGRINLLIHLIEDKLYFEVSDTGIGIDEEYLDEIFDKFRQIDNSATKEYKGTGLGLNICKRLIELMGGEIRAESEPGKGTMMKFYLPYLKVENTEIIESEEADKLLNVEIPGDEQSCARQLALIVEDNEEQRFWYSNILKNNGIDSIICTSSKDFFNAAARYLPDIVLLKMEMPKVHGHSILKAMNKYKELQRIPVLVITHTPDISIKGISNPISLLQEPVTDELIQTAIQKLVVSDLHRVKTDRLVLFEEENHLKNYLMNDDECLGTENFTSGKLILSRRFIKSLVFDGIDLMKDNFKLMKWLQTEKDFQPEQLIVVSNNPFKLIVEELQKMPGHRFIPLHTVQNCNSLDEALATYEEYKDQTVISKTFSDDE
jgi:PAS domain S-box-containing protein